MVIEQGDLSPYLNGHLEIVGSGKSYLATELLDSPTLEERLVMLQTSLQVKRFVQRWQHQWLALLMYGICYNDLCTRNSENHADYGYRTKHCPSSSNS